MTVRRSKRSLITPAGSRKTTVGTVMPMPTTESAAQVAQGRHLVESFDALGDDVELEASPERDDRSSEARVRLVIGHEKRPVHLEDVDRQAAEVGERRVAGAEVVHRQANAESLEVVQLLDREIHVSHHQALG